jgi:hypothetical protein
MPAKKIKGFFQNYLHWGAAILKDVVKIQLKITYFPQSLFGTYN